MPFDKIIGEGNEREWTIHQDKTKHNIVGQGKNDADGKHYIFIEFTNPNIMLPPGVFLVNYLFGDESNEEVIVNDSPDKMQYGGETSQFQGNELPEVQQENQEQPSDDSIDLENLTIEDALGIYRKYIEGQYDGTDDEILAEKVYDKLNRVYHKEAKQRGMSAPNYIMSNIKG